MKKYKGYFYKIEPDEIPISPREESNLGTMACAHRRYILGDAQMDPEDIHELLDTGDYYYLPLHLYDHSGITMNTTGFSCRWDSGKVGYIYAKKEDCERWGAEGEDAALKILRSEVEVYDQYLTGDVYAVMIYHEDGEMLHSCCNFYGEKEAELFAKNEIDSIIKMKEKTR